jgi:type III pantothenate kinase
MTTQGDLLLVVDVGNTQTHFGLFRPGRDDIVEQWRFATVRVSTRDELASALNDLLELRGFALSEIDGSIVSSTVSQLSVQWLQMAERYLDQPMLNVGPSLHTGMPIRIDNPREVGPDRLVNAIAAYDQVHDACVVVDFGTAINYDIVSGSGEYVGGIISPGVEISLDALAERAAALSRVEFAPPKGLIGKSTIEAIRSGIAYGFAGQVEGIVRRLRAQLGAGTKVLATGGLSGPMAPFIGDVVDVFDDLLTLKGLRLIWKRNRP